MQLYCIGDEDTVRGLLLAGVAGQEVSTPEQAAAALAGACARSDCAIVIMTQQVAEAIASKVQAVRTDRDRPLIVLIPGPAGPSKSAQQLAELVRAAVGVRGAVEEE